MLAGPLFAQLIATVPTAANAKGTTSTGIPFNPSKRMVDAICDGWANGLKALPIGVTYVGVGGAGGVPAPIVVSFPAAPAALTTFLGTMGWLGTQSLPIARIYTSALATLTSTMSTLMVPPAPAPPLIPGAGLGSLVINPAVNAGIAASGVGVFTSTLTAAFLAQTVGVEKLFIDQDAKLVGVIKLTNEITKMITALATAFATIVASAVGVSPVAGSPIGPPLSIPAGLAGLFL